MAETSPPLRQFLRFAKRQAWLIALVPVLTVAASAFIVQREAPVYQASMGIGVAQSGASPPLGSPALMQTMKNILKSNVVAQGVVTQLGLPISSAALSKKIRVQYQPDSSVLNVSYDSTDKSEALSVVGQTGVEFQALDGSRHLLLLRLLWNFFELAGQGSCNLLHDPGSSSYECLFLVPG